MSQPEAAINKGPALHSTAQNQQQADPASNQSAEI